MSYLPEPGWFPDPRREAGSRWWNGTDWTDEVRDDPPSSSTFSVEKRRDWKPWIASSLLLAVTLGGIVLVNTVSPVRSRTSPQVVTRTTVTTAPPVQHDDQACWSGTAPSVSFTVGVGGQSSQGTQKLNNQCVDLGTVPLGTFVYLSVQNEEDYGTVDCSIDVDGNPEYQSGSSGGYVIATCSGTL